MTTSPLGPSDRTPTVVLVHGAFADASSWAGVKAGFPVLSNSANRHRAVGFTPKQFHYAFTNTLSEEESAKVYERYHAPASGGHVRREQGRRSPGGGPCA